MTTPAEAINKARKIEGQVARYANNIKATNANFRTVPGFPDYEWNSELAQLRSRKTGKVQQIPVGKKKYLIFNAKGERRSIGKEEIIATLPATSAKPARQKKERAEKGERAPSKKDQIMSLHRAGKTTKEISAETGIAYNTVYITVRVATVMALHEKGKTPKQIAEETGYKEKYIKWQISK